MVRNIQNIIDVYNEKERDTANQWVNDLSSRKANNDTSLSILIGQRMHPQDTTNFLLSEQSQTKYNHIVLPAEYNKSLKPAHLRSFYDDNDGLFNPVRLSRENLDEKKQKLGVRGYNAQYLQNPSDDSNATIKESWFPVISKEDFLDLGRTHKGVIDFFCDTAFTTNRKRNDPSVILAASKIGNFLYVTSISRVWMEVPQMIEHIKAFTAANGYTPRSRIFIEPAASGLGIFQTLHQQTGLNVIKSQAQNKIGKEERVEMISPIISTKRVYLVKGTWNQQFIGEVCTNVSAHDDIKDVLCMAVAELLSKQRGTGKYNYAFA